MGLYTNKMVAYIEFVISIWYCRWWKKKWCFLSLYCYYYEADLLIMWLRRRWWGWLWNMFESFFCNSNILFAMPVLCECSLNQRLGNRWWYVLDGNHDVIASLWCWFWTIILLVALTFDNWMVNSEGKESILFLRFTMLWNVCDFMRWLCKVKLIFLCLSMNMQTGIFYLVWGAFDGW